MFLDVTLSWFVCSSLVLDDVEKQSTCELEVDAVAVDVLNRLEIESKFSKPTDSTLWLSPRIKSSSSRMIVAYLDN